MTEEKERTAYRRSYLVLLVVLVLITWGGSFVVQLAWFNNNLTRAALSGDTFGAVNSLFSAFAFAGVIVTVLMQRDELRLQRNELELARHEMKESRIAQQESADALERQVNVQLLAARVSGTSTLLTITGSNEYSRTLRDLLDKASQLTSYFETK